MLDSTSDHRVSEVDRIEVKRRLPAIWTQRASMYLGAGYHTRGQAPMRNSPPIDTIAILVQPAGLKGAIQDCRSRSIRSGGHTVQSQKLDQTSCVTCERHGHRWGSYCTHH